MAAGALRIFAELTLSIETGDSIIFCGTLVAETTTSCPNAAEGLNSICVKEALLTVISCNSYPIEEINKVAGKLLTVILKFPLSSVKVPLTAPLTVTETAPAPSLVLLFRTLPLMVIFCAMAAIVKILASKKRTK